MRHLILFPADFPGGDFPAGAERPAVPTSHAERPPSSLGSLCEGFGHISSKDTTRSSWGAVEITARVRTTYNITAFIDMNRCSGEGETGFASGAVSPRSRQSPFPEAQRNFTPRKVSHTLCKEFTVGLFFFFSEILHDRKTETRVRC